MNQNKKPNKEQIIKNALDKGGVKVEIKTDTSKLTIYNVVNKITTERTLFYSVTDEQAIKIFQKTINNDAFNDPKDFVLQVVGRWNKTTGQIKSLKPTIIATGFFEKQIGKELQKLIETIAIDRFKKLEKELGKK